MSGRQGWRGPLAEATVRLAAAGVEDPAGDARHLLAHALGLPRDRLLLALDSNPEPAALARFAGFVGLRAARRPVAQITGRRLFWGRTFGVSGDVLDPRPETETLVALALAGPFARVLDLGTGSGCLLVTLLAEGPAATGVGTDRSPAAIRVARATAAAHGVADRAAFLEADWFGDLGGGFDLIVANPPYIPEAALATLAPEVRLWEPREALTPGPDGLEALGAIVAGAPARLAPGGRLFVEVGAGQARRVAAAARAAGLAEVGTHADLDGRPRVVAARAP
ncbi:MAG: peptide chain release factor N(5)-glutamine methyltransferase [Rhodobacteraceae bacterium]|nr:peptide chain release factor N(5)-glutamine methyltransferase [Paracoccaceae bacterium]